MVVDHTYYIEKYNTEFESLWKQFASNEVKGEEEEQEHAAVKIQTAFRAKKQGQTQGGFQGGAKKYNNWVFQTVANIIWLLFYIFLKHSKIIFIKTLFTNLRQLLYFLYKSNLIL